MTSQRKTAEVGSIDADRSTPGDDLHDQVIQQLFAIGLAMQSTQRREKSPEQAIRISDHIDQLHDVLQQIRSNHDASREIPAHPTSASASDPSLTTG
jgi:signal transduction histidine kinase